MREGRQIGTKNHFLDQKWLTYLLMLILVLLVVVFVLALRYRDLVIQHVEAIMHYLRQLVAKGKPAFSPVMDWCQVRKPYPLRPS